MARKEKFFLISPFHPDFNEVHEALAEAASRFEFLTMDKSDTQTPGEKKLFQDIRDRIRSSAFVIADISIDPRTKAQNANVMLEAGFAMGHGSDPFFISRLPVRLPSDVNQYRVHIYDPKMNPDDFVDQFEHYLEELLILRGIDTDRIVRKRTSHAQILRWLNSLTRSLRDRVRSTYIDESGLWQINERIFFQPAKCTFSLTHKFDDREQEQFGESTFDQVIVECGAFYSQWNRGETPLRIVVKKSQRNGRSDTVDGEYMVIPPVPLDSVSEEEIMQEFEKKLDEILPKYTPSLSRHSPLAKRLSKMEAISHSRGGVVICAP